MMLGTKTALSLSPKQSLKQETIDSLVKRHHLQYDDLVSLPKQNAKILFELVIP